MKIKNKSSGFTIMELMLAMIAMAIVILALGSMLIFGYRGWRRGNDVVNMQRDASLAFRVLAREIRMSNSNDILDGAALTCVNNNGTIDFAKNGGHLDMSIDGTFSMRLVRDRLSSFSTTKTADGLVVVTLNLATETDQNNNTLEIATRN